MTTLKFTSKLGPSIESFISQKRITGHPYEDSGRILWHLDQMIAAKFPDCDELTQAICEAWISENSGVHQNTLVRRMSPVRELAKFLKGLGQRAYSIPSNVPGRQIHYQDHVFTDDELKAFFAAADHCKISPHNPVKHYVVPVIFRLLFTCGLRNSEARHLTVDDVDLDTGKVNIGPSKGWTARVIYVSDDMLNLMRRYNAMVHKVFPTRKFFFPNAVGDCMLHHTLQLMFHELWDNLPEAKIAKGNQPRIHSFRHAFCRYRINDWLRKGLDINAMIVYLSEYLGHSSFSDTAYYLRLAKGIYAELHKRMHDSNVAVLPEVPEDEED